MLNGHVELWRYDDGHYRFIRSKLVNIDVIINKIQLCKQYKDNTSTYKWECFNPDGTNIGKTYFLKDFND